MISRDGSIRWIEGREKIVEYDEQGRPSRMVGTIIDINERKQAELRLQRSEEEFRLTFEEASDAIFWADATTGILINCNGAAEKMLEIPREVIIGKHQTWLHPPEMAEHFAALFRESVAINKPVANVEAIVISKSGKRIPVHIKHAVTNVGGRDIIHGVFRDISELKHAEEEKLALERQFHQAQKLESLGVMAGGIAHDFNNLLQSILSNMELASMRLAPDSVPQKYLANAMISGRHASHLTNLMLTYVGKGFIAKNKLNLNELIMENIEMLKTAALAAVSIKLHLVAEQPIILADEAQILQVVMNLLTNAAESIEEQPGIIKLTTRIQNCDRTFLAASLLNEKPEPGNYLVFEVCDNGCGMSKETISRLFDPFFTTKFAGRGLGMSAVLGIIRAHHGALFVDSEIGKGTTFKVLFPMPESVQSGTVQEPIQPVPEKNAFTENQLTGAVLVVDDDKSVLKACARMVKLCGFTVITAHDGIDAVAKFRKHAEEIVAVLMDLTMPNMDGITAMSEIYGIRPDMKVILASGFNEVEVSERIASQPPSGFIRKPFSFKELEEKFRSVMPGDLPCR